jgi:ammonia channel protein AmtB
MRHGFTITSSFNVATALALAAAAALAMVACTSAKAQMQRQDGAVAGTVIRVPSAGTTVPVTTFVQTYTYQPVCETYREPFVDEYGWRVRTVTVCR